MKDEVGVGFLGAESFLGVRSSLGIESLFNLFISLLIRKKTWKVIFYSVNRATVTQSL